MESRLENLVALRRCRLTYSYIILRTRHGPDEGLFYWRNHESTRNHVASAFGLEAAAHAHTDSALGDRQAYLGMSDLARGLACPRAVIAHKLNGKSSSPSLETLLQLRRGHWLEHGIEEALTAAGQKYISQLEISIEHQGVPIKAHLDLVLFDEDAKSVTVIELKRLS